MLHVPHVVEVEAPLALLLGGGCLVLGLQGLIVDLCAGTKLVLGVGEEVVRAIADEVRAADLGVCDAELGSSLVVAAHGLLAHELFFTSCKCCRSREIWVRLTKQPTRLGCCHG